MSRKIKTVKSILFRDVVKGTLETKFSPDGERCHMEDWNFAPEDYSINERELVLYYVGGGSDVYTEQSDEFKHYATVCEMEKPNPNTIINRGV